MYTTSSKLDFEVNISTGRWELKWYTVIRSFWGTLIYLCKICTTILRIFNVDIFSLGKVSDFLNLNIPICPLIICVVYFIHLGLVDREDERKGQASKAPCSIPATTLKVILKALAPLGAGVSVIAPLPERLPGLIEGSLRSQSSLGNR